MSCTPIQAPSYREERGWLSSPIRFVLLAAAIAAIGQLLLSTAFPIAAGLAAWCLFSASVIVLNRYTEGSRFERSVHLLLAFTMEVNTVPIKAFLFPLTFFPCTLSPAGSLNGRPILMLNGYLSFASTWTYHKRRLAEAGFGPIYTMNVGSGKSIDTYAQYVREKVKEIQKETGRKDVVLIGHSKGGLVASHFTIKYAAEIGAEVTDVITLGSPLAGTAAARFGWGLDAGEMGLTSLFHQGLRERMSQYTSTRFYHIGSAMDRVVPYASALFGTCSERLMQLKETGHVALLMSSRVSDQICRWLK